MSRLGRSRESTYLVEAQSVSRLGRSRESTYLVEAQSVSRLGAVSAPHIPCGGSERVECWRSRNHTYPVDAQSVSRLGRSRHLTYPVEDESVSSVGCLGTTHTLWRLRAFRVLAVSAPHIPCGG